MRTVSVAMVLAALLLPCPATAADRHPASLRLVGAQACGAAISSWRGRALTISPDGDGVRDCAAVVFRLARSASVEFVVARSKPRPGLVHVRRLAARAGLTTVVWQPPPTIPARTYLTRLSVRDGLGKPTWLTGPVIRVRGTHARFERESYVPGETATLRISGGSGHLVEVLDAATAEPAARARIVRGSATRIHVGRWSPGVYVARLRLGETIAQAPLVVRASSSSRPRVAVVLPTSTWQAYNLHDGDGDGAGDSWYATPRRESARLDRPFMGAGLPPFFYRYDRPFLEWLRAREHRADFLTDGDLDRVPDAATLVRRYDLLVFPGHHEYVTAHEFDLIEAYRDLGGNLAFLRADNFHWRVVRDGTLLRRKEQWRKLNRPRPEASLVGVQYRASDNGFHRGSFVVRDVACAPWLFAGTGLSRGSRFGWARVEIDANDA